MSKRYIKILLILLGSILSIFSVLSSVLLRDGLGPDSIRSTGYEALERVVIQSFPLVVVGVILIAIGIKLKSESSK